MKNLEENAVLETGMDPQIEEKFNKYVEFFSLSEDDLQKTILDVGTAEGSFVRYLRDVIGNKNAYGVDEDAPKFGVEIDGIFIADGLDLPFDDGTFELVVGKHYLSSFMEDGQKSVDALLEMLRVVRPGGRLVADVISSSTYQRIANEEKLAGKDASWPDSKIKALSFFISELESLRQSGLSVTINPNDKGDNIITIEKPLSE